MECFKEKIAELGFTGKCIVAEANPALSAIAGGVPDLAIWCYALSRPTLSLHPHIYGG